MPAWYDILTLGREGGGNPEHVREARAQVDALLRREKERGIAPDRTVLAGFSQGGALALHAGTRYPETLGGILVLSGYEVLPGTREAEAAPANRRTPMLFCHGTQDPLVPVAGGRAAFAGARDARSATRSGASSPWRTRSPTRRSPPSATGCTRA